MVHGYGLFSRYPSSFLNVLMGADEELCTRLNDRVRSKYDNMDNLVSQPTLTPIKDPSYVQLVRIALCYYIAKADQIQPEEQAKIDAMCEDLLNNPEMNPEAAAGSPAESGHKELTERPAGPEAAVVLYVSQNPESEAFHTIRDAIRHAEEHSGHPIVIQIAPGIYREHLVIRTKGLTLRGETRENVEASCIPDEGKEKEAAASSLRNEVRITGSRLPRGL